MPQIINTNIGSINAQRNLNRSQESLNLSLQRLSSGLRINSAKDDAAGLAISERFTSQIRGTNQAIRNANDGISVAQVAEGALQESSNILQRIRELAIQSANDSNGAADRNNLQREVNQLKQELDRIASTTSFNGRNLLDGSFSGTQFHIGAFAFQTVQVDIGNVRNTAVGSHQITTYSDPAVSTTINAARENQTQNNVAGQTLTVAGTFGTEDVVVSAGDSARRIAELINRASEGTGVRANAISYAKLDTLTLAGGAQDTLSFDLTGTGTATISATVANANDLGSLADAINAESGTTGISATLNTEGTEVTLFNGDGEDILIENYTSANAGGSTIEFTGLSNDGVTDAGAAVQLDDTDGAVAGGSVIFDSSRTYRVDTTAAGSLFQAATTVSALQSVDIVDISTQRGSNDAIAIVEGALAFIADVRANLGAVQNRLQATISNLENVSENVSAARSRIRDADFALETANLSRAQILQQAGISVLSQANALPQQVLSLLQ